MRFNSWDSWNRENLSSPRSVSVSREIGQFVEDIDNDSPAGRRLKMSPGPLAMISVPQGFAPADQQVGNNIDLKQVRGDLARGGE